MAFKNDILLHSRLPVEVAGTLGGWYGRGRKPRAMPKHLTPHFHVNGPALRFTMWPICGGTVMALFLSAVEDNNDELICSDLLIPA